MATPESPGATSTETTTNHSGRRASLVVKAAALALGGAFLASGAADPSCGKNAPKAADNFSCTSEYNTQTRDFFASISGQLVVSDISTHFHIETTDAHLTRPVIEADTPGSYTYTLDAYNRALSRIDEVAVNAGSGAAASIKDTVNFTSGPYAGQSIACSVNNVRI